MDNKNTPWRAVALIAGAIALIAYAPAWKRAGSFNTGLAIWEKGYPPDGEPAGRDMLYMQGHSYCSGGAQPDDGTIGAWLQNRQQR